MSIWTDIGRFLADIATDTFANVVERLRTVFAGDAEVRRRVAFSIAIIALSAKMAKADGVVTANEVEAFREVFDVPPEEQQNVKRLYNLAKQDVAGYHAYAMQVRTLFPGNDPDDQAVLHDVLDALFHIAKADGVLHDNEILFLEDIALSFGFDAHDFERIKGRHCAAGGVDPYVILEAEPDWDFQRLRRQYLKRVSESHPDRMIARGVPPEFVILANDRLAAINGAWEAVRARHARMPGAPEAVS